MNIWEYFTYGLLLSVLGGGAIAGPVVTENLDNNLGLWLFVVGIAAAAVGSILVTIGIIAKGVEVGTRD